MLVALMARDKPKSLDIRKANRAAHLDYIEATGVVSMAGPFLDENGSMTGSLVILDVADMDAARNWAENDPYAKAGLFETVVLSEWKKVVG
ncbi:hypothetical protein CVM52_07420 [Pseudooceanicola lipolyticus]|uniref:YCII-related domain-containing protein n=1 Tax=Pseudooceanicola lipolyticus TaxID=2029104 RepID=A0A2M8J3P3_9RHOB|nr:YciI family protein [Pseudooceanicola lipolyticus]PJE37393.1 hypothetical protein CVM52_07420 [Pseudooceanicola lipolyticus]